MLQNYSIIKAERVPIIKNLARQTRPTTISLSLRQSKKDVIQKMVSGTLSKKFKPQHIETIKSLEFHKLIRQANENVDEWMGRIRVTAI